MARSPFSSSRRGLLGGLSLGAGGLLLQPLLGLLATEARGQPITRKRIVFVIEGCGFNTGFFTPTDAAGAKFSTSATQRVESNALTLNPTMAPFLRHQDRLLLVDGLSNWQPGDVDHHSARFRSMTANGSVDGLPQGISIDQHLANTVGAQNIFSNVALGIWKSPQTTLMARMLSAGKGAPVPAQCSPRQAFTTLFAGAAADAGSQALFKKRGSMLDHLVGDLKRVNARLSGPEKWKLEQYLHSVQTLQRRQQRLELAIPTLTSCTPTTEKLDSANAVERCEAQFELATAALACGLTQVATISSGVGSDGFDMTYDLPGLDGRRKHAMGHGIGGDGFGIIHRFHFELMAKMADRLKATPEGNGTMLDNTAIVYLNENGDQHHSHWERYPLIVLGNAGGALKADGRYVRYPLQGKPGHKHLANFYNTLCHAMGVPKDDFGFVREGSASRPSDGPLSELLA